MCVNLSLCVIVDLYVAHMLTTSVATCTYSIELKG